MRTMNIANIEQKTFQYIPFSRDFLEAFGKREKGGIWIVYGKSGHGKTSFALQLAKEFDNIGYRTLFASLEMGISADLQEQLRESGVRSSTNNISFVEDLTVKDLDEQLKKQRAPRVVIIDSLQYFIDQCGATAEDIINLRKKYRSKIFVFLSHVDGKEVDGRGAYVVKRDSFVRIQVEGFRAIYKGRGRGGTTGFFTIWKEGADNYWLPTIKEQEEDKAWPKELQK